jgi:pimeloyl-ACP methyl ester carboxylesterase
MINMQQKNIKLNGVEVAYHLYENPGAPAIILVHGFGEDGAIWHNLLPSFCSRYRVIVPDLPGSGASPHNSRMMNIDEMAKLMHQLAVFENAGKHLFFGHSMGGYIGLAYAEHFGRELAALGLVHSTAYADNEAKKAARQKGIAFMNELGAQKFLNQAIPNLFTKNYVVHQRDKVEELLKKGAMFAVETLTGYYKAMLKRPNRIEVLRTLRAPVFFAAGFFDEAVPFIDMLQQCHLPDSSYIHILENTAHVGMLEEPEELNRGINNFLNRIN